ncbi:SDR family NAD(P)-dependent oxidoreductase [Weissella hellenica]|uniref:NAD(P)-dependent dehydrogenase, short-chain alcohol dehydrogenase family n=1 Tax=Weissella hellenica TaxID=46256 RepID=A0A4Y4G1M9_WEIHE|nr:SDR family NAD(P)-dependent oxidoreductase [Weissella hellenica]NKY67248.1 SDR family NAD(P)-dependent oxidoreductase [Weissella hellenica]GED36139.1 dehydrogenase [Weissella hellenica]SCB99955.1 NAD(P)-dependent dehydrogenase, short-chain alcohol dehydrogenase family [Weissella hellenica]
MVNKIVLVTGANSGIGYQTALALARQGYHVIIHGRNEQKVQIALAKIKEQSGNEELDTVVADLSLMSEVKRLANEIKGKYDHLDALINNAGSQMGKDQLVTSEGNEKTMAINVFAPLLLSESLLSLLEKSSDGRIVTVSSASYNQGTSDKYLDDIELENNYEFSRAYGLSKLYVLWIMWHLNDKLQKKGINNVTVNCMEPGSALTNLGSEAAAKRPAIWKFIYILWRPMMLDPAVPGETNAKLATTKEFYGLTGKFFDKKGRIEKENRQYYSKENEQKVWDYCMDIVRPYLKN